MTMTGYGRESICLLRDVNVVRIPDGTPDQLPKGHLITLSQSLGGHFTVLDETGHMVRIAGEDADAEEALPPTGVAVTRDALVVSTESKGLFYSRDSGATWFKHSAFSSGQTYTLAAARDFAKLLLATPAAIAISEDSGVSWERIAKPPDSVISIAMGDDGTVLCGTQDDGLWVYR